MNEKSRKALGIMIAAALLATAVPAAIAAPDAIAESDAVLSEMPDNAIVTKYSFATDMLKTSGEENSGDVYEWKVTTTPVYFYVGEVDFDTLSEITIRWGYRKNSAVVKFYAYDGGEVDQEKLNSIAADSSVLGEPIAAMATSKKAEWGYSTGDITKDAVTLSEGDSAFTLDESASQKLTLSSGMGTKPLIIELSGDISEWGYFDNITLTTLDNSPYSVYSSISAGKKEISSEFGVKFNTTDSTFDGFLAQYDADGALVDVKKTQISQKGEQKLTMSIPDDNKYTYKSFMWKDMEPVTDVVSKTVNKESAFADTKNVNLTDGSLFETSEETGIAYVKSIDVDRLLAPSYEMHNLSAPNGKSRYGGWERKRANNWTSSGGADSYTLAGHSLGHWMSAAAVMYNDTGDEEILQMLNYAVTKLDELQTQTDSAYIGGCPEDTFTKCFAGNTNWVNNYWVPWYGIHKIYQGLVDAYLYGDTTTSETAFKVLKKFADWAVDGTSNLTDAQMQSVLNTEYGGMNEIFALMYEFTGEDKYLTTARRFTHDSILTPLINNTDSLSGLHANTQIPKIVGAAELYEQDPNTYADYRTASENFWNFVINNRSYAIGGNSIAEHFEAQGLESLGVKTCESCNTYNMMRLTEHLFSWDHDTKYMDWYENALFNHILGQQEPETGAKMYFVSLLQGHHRVYEEKDNSWWCCTGTGMENPGRYTRVTYFEDENDLYVNLYMANDYEWTKKGLKFNTETNYPTDSAVKMSVTEGSAQANIKLRVPSWSTGMTAEVNGETYTPGEDGYITISRVWSAGDVLNINIPMSVSTYYSRTANQIAYKYGPITLAADLGSCVDVSGVSEYISNETKIDTVTASEIPYLIFDEEKPESIVVKSETEPLTFTIPAQYSSTGKDITLKPFYGIHHEFYTVYFNTNTEIDPFEKALNDVTIDKVEPDGQQDEIGHGLETNTSGSTHQGSFSYGSTNYMWRDAWGAVDSGSELPYFSYNMSVQDGENKLCIALWGSDVPFTNGGVKYNREFNIYVDGTLIGEASINNDKPGEAVYKFYDIPTELTQGKESVTVKLQAKNSSSCACMLEMRITSAVVSE